MLHLYSVLQCLAHCQSDFQIHTPKINLLKYTFVSVILTSCKYKVILDQETTYAMLNMKVFFKEMNTFKGQ